MPLRLGSQQQGMNCQQIPLDKKPMVSTPESTRKFLAGPALTSVKFSNLIPESQQCMKSTEFTSEPKWQSVKHVTLSSVSLPQAGNSVWLSPRPFPQNVTSGNQIPQTSNQITESPKVIYRPGHQMVEYTEISRKIRHQVPKLVNHQDMGSSEMTKGLGHKSTETIKKSMRLTPKPTDKVIDSLGVPQQLDLPVPAFVDVTPTPSDQDSNSSELTPPKSYPIPETLELLSCSLPQFKDFKELQTKQVTGSDRMTLEFKNRVAEIMKQICEARQGKEFLRVTSKPVNRETECAEKFPRPCPQDLGPVVVSSEKRSQREQSVVCPPRPSGEEAGRIPKPQYANMENASITPIESLEKIMNFVTISPKSDQVTESAKTHLHGPLSEALPKVSESVTVIPGPPLQVIKSVMIPEPTSLVSKCADSTPKLHDVIFSEFSPRLWLQNVESKKLIAEPTHQILETIDSLGFQVIKTILVPKPLLLIVKSEELAPGPSPQAIETIGVATRSNIKVKDCLSLFPRPHLQDMVKPMELTPRANIQGNSAELILQQTSSLEEPPVLTQKQRLQAEKFLGFKTESPKDMDIEDLTQGRVLQNRDPEMITSEKLQAENYFSRLIHSPSIPFISSSVKTTELASLQGSGMPEVSRALAMKNFGVGILQSPESYTDTIMIRSSALPLVLPHDKTGNTVRTLYPKIWEMDVISKEGVEKKQMGEFGDSLQSYSPYPLRLLPSEFQAGFGARRNPIRSFLGRQQNVWESHVCRQRLPRKYLSNMLMLGNVLGTTMERKLCSPQFLTEGTTMDIGLTIQNLFGVPAELMEFSQSLVERGPRTISQTSVFKNYIQRHILCHGNEKRMPLKMWTRGSTSSIIQQYSGTRLGIKKTNSKLSDIFQEVTQQVSASCPGAQFPALSKSESPLGILYKREDPVSREQSKNSQIGSPTRTFESHHSLKANYLSQAKTGISEQLHLLKDLQLKIAAKLLRSQIPHNVPPPLASGLVLKYPICLQCGRCSGFNCCHKLQSAFGPYLLIYPQIHLLSTPEGHGEIRLHLGFRLRTGKRPQVSKYRGRNRADTWKSTAPPSRRKAKVYTPASKSPTSTRDFQSRSPQSPTSVQVHVRQKQWGSRGVVGKTEAKDSGYYEFCQVHSLSESGFESNQDEKWVTSSLRKTSDLKYPVKKITQGLKTQNRKLFKTSRTLEESPSGTLTDPSRSKSIETSPTSTTSSKRPSKKSSQPKFIQLLFQGLRQAFQTAHRMLAITGRKSEDRTRSDHLWSSKNLHSKQKAKDYCLTEDDKGASTPVVKPRSTGSTPKQEDRLQETHDQCRQAQRPKQASSSHPKPSQLQKTMVSERDAIVQASSITESLRILENVNGKTKNYSAEICGLESNVGTKFLAEESVAPDSLLTSTLQSQFKDTHSKKKEQYGFFRERALPSKPSERTYHSLSEKTHHRSVSERRHCSPSQKKHSSPSDRTLRSLSERSHRSPSQRKDRSPFVRTPQSFSDRSHHNFFKRKGRSPLGRSRSPSGRSRSNLPGRRPARSSRSPRERRVHTPSPKGRLSLSGRSQHRPSSQRGRSPSKRSQLSPIQRTRGSPSERSHGSLSERSPSSPFPSRPDASLVPARRGGGISKEAAAEAAWSRDAFPAAAPSEAARRK
ncbi:uncharacterized protein C2orf16 homolog [Cricetulus griseus]|uniref:Uncharacterized protein C2orf16 homolog n=2 Tax=Cricetulus griseus TaxID=10029 RepID=A0A9J7GA11_CRIGR|nr:uncharacterized protein C2orf16 homolog [Cricetulus griseus]XP_027280186.2 uncharacterized protein C2orf16 homolog [Cricetulus griseus]